MNDEFLNFRQIFDAAVNNHESDEIATEEIKAEIESESARIISALRHNLFHIEPARAKHYIAQHQQVLNTFLEELHNLPTGIQTGSNKEMKQVGISGIVAT